MRSQDLEGIHSRRLASVRVQEELAAESIRDEIIWPSYASLEKYLGYFILAP